MVHTVIYVLIKFLEMEMKNKGQSIFQKYYPATISQL